MHNYATIIPEYDPRATLRHFSPGDHNQVSTINLPIRAEGPLGCLSTVASLRTRHFVYYGLRNDVVELSRKHIFLAVGIVPTGGATHRLGVGFAHIVQWYASAWRLWSRRECGRQYAAKEVVKHLSQGRQTRDQYAD